MVCAPDKDITETENEALAASLPDTRRFRDRTRPVGLESIIYIYYFVVIAYFGP